MTVYTNQPIPEEMKKIISIPKESANKMTDKIFRDDEVIDVPVVVEEKPKKRGRPAKAVAGEEPIAEAVDLRAIASKLGAAITYQDANYVTLSKPSKDHNGKVTGTLINGVRFNGLSEEKIIEVFEKLGY